MILSVSNQKGGVTKTTLTFNLVHILAEEHKVLAVDLDPQGSLTTIFSPDSIKNTIYDVMCDGVDTKDAVIAITDNLHLIAGGIELANAELELVNAKGRESFLKSALERVSGEYEYILVDCPPSLGLLLINSLNASDKVIIPTTTDYLSYKGLDLLLNTIAKVKVNFNPELNILGVVATSHDNRTLHNREILELLQDEFEILGTIGTSTRVKDATLAGEPLHRFDKKHKIVDEYKKIAGSIIDGK